MAPTNRDGRILFIGNANKALLDARDLTQETFDVHENVVDGIYAASRVRYKAIYLVVSSATRALGEILSSLNSGPKTKVYLLTPILEEPFVRHLLQGGASDPDLSKVVDYLICPIRTSRLKQLSETDAVEGSSARDSALQQRMQQLEKLATEGKSYR